MNIILLFNTSPSNIFFRTVFIFLRKSFWITSIIISSIVLPVNLTVPLKLVLTFSEWLEK